MGLLRRFKRWYIRWRIFGPLAIFAVLISVYAWAAVPVTSPLPNLGANIAIPFSVSYNSPSGATSPIFLRAHRAIVPVSLTCVSTGASTPTDLIIDLYQCDENADNCVSFGASIELDALLTPATTETFTDPDAPLPLRIDEGDYFSIQPVSAFATGTKVNCELRYIYY